MAMPAGPRTVWRFARKLPAGCLGGLALVAIVEFALSRHESARTVDVAATWQYSRRSAAEDATRARVLCFGDSLVKFGVVPRIIEARTGLPTCNLAVFEGRPATSYLLLKRALDAGARPSAIIVNSNLLYRDPVEYPAFWAELATPADAALLAWRGRDASFWARYLLAYHLASVRYRDVIRSEFLSMLNGEEVQNRLYHRLNRRNWAANRGATIVPGHLWVRDPAPKELDHDMVVNGFWKCEPLNALYNDKFLDLARDLRLPVFWILPPAHPGLARRFDRPAWSGVQERFLRDLQRRYDNIVVVDGTRADYDASVLGDLVHLNRRGASAFSDALGIIIADRMKTRPGDDRPRWLALPPFREVPDPPVEDLAQSRIVIDSLQR